jgi:hypothetical protein
VKHKLSIHPFQRPSLSSTYASFLIFSLWMHDMGSVVNFEHCVKQKPKSGNTDGMTLYSIPA